MRKIFSRWKKFFTILLSISSDFWNRAGCPHGISGLRLALYMAVWQLGWHLGMPQSETEKVNFRLLSHIFRWLSWHFRCLSRQLGMAAWHLGTLLSETEKLNFRLLSHTNWTQSLLSLKNSQSFPQVTK